MHLVQNFLFDQLPNHGGGQEQTPLKRRQERIEKEDVRQKSYIYNEERYIIMLINQILFWL